MKQFFGAAMLGCGILIAGLSGLCTLLLAGTALMDTSTQDAREFAGMIPAVLIAGGIPCVIGIALFLAGRHVVRSAERETQDSAADQSEIFK